MIPIVNLLEPSRLLLVWQRPMIDSGRRSRRVVGELIRKNDGEAVFRYLSEGEDFQDAREEGFQGYPAFRMNRPQHDVNVMEAFMCRLPSRKRGDFVNYLAAHSLPSDFEGSDFSLLAHTGARLPGDGFELIPDLSGINSPFEIIIEVAGTRHQNGVEVDSVSINDQVLLQPEPKNAYDPGAIEVIHSEVGRLGYIPKPYCNSLRHWIDSKHLTASVQKLNGRPDRRLAYLRISVS